MQAAGARDLWQHWTVVDAALVDAVHAAGGRVVVWTVNDVDAARDLAALGVDGICTDVPGALRPAFARAAS
jgi:glycerophosphoryl diester phosphodiesterase